MKTVFARLFALVMLAAAAGVHAATPPPPPAPVTLRDRQLTGSLDNDRAEFTLTATAVVPDRAGGAIELLSGPLALTDLGAHAKWRLRAETNRFVAEFDQAGEYPVRLKFRAAVTHEDPWQKVAFHVPPGAVLPVTLTGLPADTRFHFAGAARPERTGADFTSFLPADGRVDLAWTGKRPAAEGKLFYAAELWAQISVAPGLMRQVAVLEFQVMQGEMGKVSLRLRGAGEVTRVLGEPVLGWSVTPVAGSPDRLLEVRLTRPQKDRFALQIQTQTPLGAFPQVADSLQLQPEGATRFAGSLRLVNEGAVRLEVLQADGLSQISPEQFPETDATKAAFRPGGGQRFAYRFAGGSARLRLQADQILPELAVSEVLAYHLAENELAIDAELELEIREAPLRELLLRIPKGYALAKISASGMSDYFTRDVPELPDAELRLVYGQPVSGRQVIQLRLERNQPAGGASWPLPRIEVPRAKSVRGNLGVAADAGFRLTPERTVALTEQATAFFPRKTAGLQAAFRIAEPAWEATVRVERLPQTVQADVLHLFSIGEGIAYGSSVLNYTVAGAPMGTFKVELAAEYFNVEFTGKDIRNWQKTDGGYLVQLHTPVAGAYTLLATYERPFKAQGETLAFTGARPLDAQAEQGHTLVVSAYQFRVQPVEVSPGLLPLEPGEVPAEYRLLFDAPLLAAYRYPSRPFNLRLALSPLAPGDSLSQVVDRARLTTRISKEGQVLTEALYFVKNRGNAHLRLTLAPGTELWSATVNNAPVVPVVDGAANLIPLPPQADPDAVLSLVVKVAAKSPNAGVIPITAPLVGAPVLLTEWRLAPDEGRRLEYRRGTTAPPASVPDRSGFAGLAALLTGPSAGAAAGELAFALGLIVLAGLVWWYTGRPGVYRFSARFWFGGVVGLGALGLAAYVLTNLCAVARVPAPEGVPAALSRELNLEAPVQPAGATMSVEVANLPVKVSVWPGWGGLWPLGLAAGLLLAGLILFRRLAPIAAWGLLAWLILRRPDGAGGFGWLLTAFLVVHLLIPAGRRLLRLETRPRRQPPTPPAAPSTGAAPAAAAVVLAALGWLLAGTAPALAGEVRAPKPVPAPLPAATPELLTQQIRVEDRFVLAKAHLRWVALKGQSLSLVTPPAVLTKVDYPTKTLRLVAAKPGTKAAGQLEALVAGTYDITLTYELPVITRGEENGFYLPTPAALVNEVQLTLANLDVEVVCPQAVFRRKESGAAGTTVATLSLAPEPGAWIGWQPRRRDARKEQAVYYAEFQQLYVPAAGVVEGAHWVTVRPAQGELAELLFTIPAGATITDVTGPGGNEAGNSQNLPATVSQWRFDPDNRQLRVTLNPPQSKPFSLLLRSQAATGPLPLSLTVGQIALEGTAGQIGLLGVATGGEVQLDAATPEGCTPINLEDFATGWVPAAFAARFPGLAVRRAFRAGDPRGTLKLQASAVEPDVRVETQDTLSLGEDRTVLAANWTVDITRAGIFSLSFALPGGFEVEAVGGNGLSHWTELKSETNRVITLHLKGRTEGRQTFTVSLAGPGVRATNGWRAPQLLVREAGKQQGTLLVVPEQGMRLQAATRTGVTQLDPQKSGVRQKGVLAFRILQATWLLTLDLEQVEPWIQVTSLQQALINEAQVRVTANLQYQIENTGLKSLRVRLPANAAGVRFQGDQVADFLPVPGGTNAAGQIWEIKLHRRVIGQYRLQAAYQTVLPERAPAAELRGVEALEVNLQRGFVTVEAAGRLQVRAEAPPAALQPTEWQGIPRALQQDLPGGTASLAYRLVEPAFTLPLKLERHEAAKLLPARVREVQLASILSDDGVMLTRARLDLAPGDKRLLELTLPPDSKFWFAFVNQNAVWPRRAGERILIPLEPPAKGSDSLPVEFYYTSPLKPAQARALDCQLLAPKFDLPLENVTWQVHLHERWRVRDWAGAFQLETNEVAAAPVAVTLESYLQQSAQVRQAKTAAAEEMLLMGNSLLEKGDPQQARRAFQAAYGLSQGDLAFNEDARVQLNNLKLQQALVGLNVRQSINAPADTAPAAKLRDRLGRTTLNYSQQDAKDLISNNSADDNTAFMKLAGRLIQQQDAAISRPAAIRATLPEGGRQLTFRRAVVVDPWADLRIDLTTQSAAATSWSLRVVVLGFTLLLLAAISLGARALRPTES